MRVGPTPVPDLVRHAQLQGDIRRKPAALAGEQLRGYDRDDGWPPAFRQSPNQARRGEGRHVSLRPVPANDVDGAELATSLAILAGCRRFAHGFPKGQLFAKQRQAGVWRSPALTAGPRKIL